MKNRKKIVALFVMLVILATGVSVTGCGNGQTAEGSSDNVTTASNNAGKNKTIASVDDLEGAKIGVQLGTTGDIYASDYEGDEAGTTIERYNKGTDAIQALSQNKVDCVILDEQPSIAYTEKNKGLSILEEAFAIEDYAICIGKDKPELKEQINQALATLKEDGTLVSIISNYIGSDDEKGKTPYEKKEVERTNGTIIVATNAAFKPYEYYENGEVVGIDMDIMQAICDELGMELQIEDMEFDSIITAVQSGKADVGAAGMTVTEDRLKNIDFTDSYTTAKQVIIVNNGTAESGVSFTEKLYDNFVKDHRYQYILKGLGNTIIITIFAILIGIVLGFLIAIVRTNHDRTGNMKILNAICKIYLTIIRGTPALVQLLIIYYVIFASVHTSKVVVAIIAFGLNSAAYVAEVVRSGIMAVDPGQFEAGRSLGLGYKDTMVTLILPQATKNILPALCNEFISLIKETSISGYIGLVDLTKGGDIIRSLTYEAFLPLITIALIYLVVVVTLTSLVGRLERRLRTNER